LGLIPARLFTGRATGPTGGHSDRAAALIIGAPCGCCNAMVYCMAITTVPTRCKLVREQMRQGATR
jgi:hypothetical protein